ncbi:MAG: VCBS repeat-containing protein [Saprospiraceae bacterium]|nr:VCBS repeat-containing protein [Saprospiraceae bacterium]
MKYFQLILLLFPWCLQAQGLFTKITDAGNPAVVFTNTPAPYKGVAWIDIDNDNYPDLFVSQRSLFRNNHNGNFTQLANVSGATTGQNAAGSSWADIDNDGHPDCITASLISGYHHNNGDNTFTPMTTSLQNFTDYSGWDCALADVDNNGRLDFTYVHACCAFHPTGPFSCRFFLQNTDGSFNQITGYEFTDSLAAYTIPIWADYDMDGDMDLFIGSGPVATPPGALPDYNYKNMLKETGTFSLQRFTGVPFKSPQDGQTYNFIDADNDGDLDVCLTNYALAPTRFYRNNNGAYQSETTPFTTIVGHLANCWGDVDNDGDLDVLLTEDGVNTIKLYRNNGDATFAAAATAGTAGNTVCGMAIADYDNDGDLDFYTNGSTEGRALFRNATLAGTRAWAAFTLEGTQSNRSAIGATLRLKAKIGGSDVWQIRQVSAHNSFQSQNDLRQHFGLNDATVIDSLEVRWPSGLTESFAGIAVKNFYKITEGQGITTPVTEPAQSAAFDVMPNPVTREFDVTAPEKITAVEMFDSGGKIIPVQAAETSGAWRIWLYGNPPAGTYFIRVHFKNGETATRSIVKF